MTRGSLTSARNIEGPLVRLTEPRDATGPAPPGTAAAKGTAATRRRTLLATAAVLVLTVAAVWFALARSGDRSGPAAAGVAVRTARLDLRPFAMTRSHNRTTTPEAVTLARGLASVTILLPVGAEPGEYEVQLLDAARRSVATTNGAAAIR